MTIEPPPLPQTTSLPTMSAPPNEPLAQPSPALRRKFRLHIVSFIIAVSLVLWLMIWPSISTREGLEMTVAYRMGTFIGAAVFASLLGAFAWLVGRRSNFAGNVIFSVVLGMHLTGTILVDLRREVGERNRATLAKLDQLQQQALNEDRAKLEAGELDFDADQFNRRVAALDQVAQDATGDARLIMSAVAELIRTLAQPMERYNQAVQAFGSEGGVDPSTMKSEQAIHDRMALLQNFQGANEAVMETVRAMPTKYHELLTAKGLSSQEIARELASLRANRRFTLLLDIRATDARLCEVMQAQLQLLASNWGKWHVDGEGTVVLQTDLLEQYKGHASEIQQLAAKQSAIQKELVTLEASAAKPQ